MPASTRCFLRRASWGAAFLIFPSLSAFAQNLAKFPGLSEIQSPVASAVQSVCGQLTTFSAETALPAEQGKLLASCRKMVQTANALTAEVRAPRDQSLGLTEQQLRDAVQAVGHEEVAVQGRSAVEAAGGGALGIRLFALRNGARGFGVANLVDRSKADRGFADQKLERDTGGAAADEPAGRLGGFLNLNANTGDKATTAREDGFDFKNQGITAGLDYRFSDSLVAGVALTYGETDAAITSALGNADSETNAVSAYGSWYSGKLYLDAHLSYSRNDYDTVRNIVVVSQTSIPGFNTAATGRTKGRQSSAVLGAGYDIDRGNLLITPYGRLGFLNLKIDAYTEAEPNHGLALDVGSQSLKSVQTALGFKIALTSSTSVGVLVPFVSIEWNHEFENKTRSLTAKYTNDPFGNFFAIPTDTPDRNYGTLSAGLSAQFRNGLSGFVTLSTVQGMKDVKNHGLAMGFRTEF